MNDNSPVIHSGADHANHTSRKGTADYNAIASSMQEDGLPDSRAKAIVLAIIELPMLAMLAWTWPGYLGYDHLLTIMSIEAGQPSSHHSLLWGFLADPIIMSGSWGVGIYLLLQVAVLIALDYGACMRASRALSLSRRRTIALAAFIGLWPARVMYSVYVGTDPLWAALLAWFASVMLGIASNGLQSLTRLDMGKLVVAIVFLVNLRKNGIVVVSVALLALAVIYWSKHWKRVLALFIALELGVGAYACLNTVATLKGIPSEPYGPALTMMVKAVMDGAKLDAESQSVINKYGGLDKLESEWDPLDTDQLKGVVGFKGNGREILSTTWNVCSQKPGSCLSTWFHLMEGYLNPFMSPSRMVYEAAYGGRGYYTDFSNKPQRRFDEYCKDLGCSETLKRHFSPDNWNWRRQSLDDLQRWAQRDKIGHVVWFLFFNVSAPMWITVIAAGIAVAKRRWKIVASLYLPMLALIGMFLLISPIALYRYSLHVDWSVPIMLAQCLNSSRKRTPDLGEGDSLSRQACQKRGKKQRTMLMSWRRA